MGDDLLGRGPDLALTSQTCPTSGAGSGPCSFTFTFQSATTGAKRDAIVCAGGGSKTTVSVVATVIPDPPWFIAPNPAALTAVVASSATVTFTVTNNGGAATGALTATIDGGPDFRIVADDCAAPLASLGTCTIQVAFSPASAGARTGLLTVADSANARSATAILKGIAVPVVDGGITAADAGD